MASQRTATSLAAAAAVDAPPTRVRYGVLSFMCTLGVVLYLDRICWGVAKIPIHRDLHISDWQLSWIDAAFMIPYGLFEMPIGLWGDRHGARGVLTRIVLCWSLFTMLTGTISFFWGFVLVRFLFGAGEAGALPNAARVITRWFSAGSRGPAQGLMMAATQLGGALAPALTGFLIARWIGWRWTFGLYGVIGVVWALSFYWWFRDDPSEHPGMNEAERRLLSQTAPRAVAHAHPPIPWRLVLTNRNVWLLGAAMNAGAFGFYMCVFSFPRYLEEARGVMLTGAGSLASTIQLGGAAGCLAGGFIGNWVLLLVRSRRMARSIVGAGGFGAAACCMTLSVYCNSAIAATLLVAGAIFFGQVQLTSWWAVTSEISGEHQAAMFGLMNSMGAFGAALSNLFFNGLSTWLGSHGYTGRAQWEPAFYVYSGIYVLGAICWLLVDASRPIQPPRASQASL